MILAAGRGERMRPLTDVLPKPLLRAGGKALIEYHLENLARAGFAEIIINHAHLGHLIEAALDNGERYGVNIRYSHEPVALETAGGITQALPIITGQPRWWHRGAPISRYQCRHLLRDGFFHLGTEAGANECES